MIRKSTIFWIMIHIFTVLITVVILLLTDDMLPGVIAAYTFSLIIQLIYVLKRAGSISIVIWFFMAYIALFYVSPIASYIWREFTGHHLIKGEQASFIAYNILAIAGLHLYNIGREVAQATWVGRTSTNYQRFLIRSWKLNLVLFAMVSLLYLALIFSILDAGSLFAASAMTRGDRIASVGWMQQIATYMFLLALPLYVLLPMYIRKHPYSILIWVALLLPVEIIYFLLFRSRSFFVSHLVGFVVGGYFQDQIIIVEYLRESFRFPRLSSPGKRIFKLILSFAIIFLIGVLSRFARGALGTEEKFQTPTITTFRIQMLESVIFGDLGYSSVVIHLIDTVPDVHDYLYGQSYWRVLLMPIPRAIWPNKPPNTQRIVGEWILPGTEVLTVPPGIIGDLYINFGFIGIFGMILFGFSLGKLELVKGFKNILFIGVAFMPIFHLARGGFTNPIQIGIVAFISCAIVANYIMIPASNEHRS